MHIEAGTWCPSVLHGQVGAGGQADRQSYCAALVLFALRILVLFALRIQYSRCVPAALPG